MQVLEVVVGLATEEDVEGDGDALVLQTLDQVRKVHGAANLIIIKKYSNFLSRKNCLRKNISSNLLLYAEQLRCLQCVDDIILLEEKMLKQKYPKNDKFIFYITWAFCARRMNTGIRGRISMWAA